MLNTYKLIAYKNSFSLLLRFTPPPFLSQASSGLFAGARFVAESTLPPDVVNNIHPNFA